MTRTAQHARLLATAQREAAEAAWGNECAPTYALNKHVARARREMGEARWAELQKEWEA